MEKITRAMARLARWEHFGLLVLVMASLILHLAFITQPADPMFDEIHYVTDARRILSGSGTERVEHPPVGKLGVAAGIRVFGDNPWGWRMPSLILGTVELILFYGICRRLGARQRVTYLATFLFSLENLTFIHTGTAMLDIYLVFFMMLAFWLYLKGLEVKKRLFNVWWLFMAIAIALSALSKLNGVFTAIPIGLHWLLAGYKKPESAALATLPVAAAGTEPTAATGPYFVAPPQCPACDSVIIEPASISTLEIIGASPATETVAPPLISSFAISPALPAAGPEAPSVVEPVIIAPPQCPICEFVIIEPAPPSAGKVDSTAGMPAPETLPSDATLPVIPKRSRWNFITRYIYSLPFVVYGLATPAFFMGLLMVGNYIIWKKWMDPIGQLKNMSNLMESIKFTGYTAPLPSRPWEWVLSPTNSLKIYQWIFKPAAVDTVVLPYSYTPHVTGMTSPTIWLIGLAVIPYVVWRAFKKDDVALFVLCWLIGMWVVWIPTSIVTDRVTFAFYYLPSVGAMCLGGALILNSLLEKSEARLRGRLKRLLSIIVALFVTLHLLAFCLLSPDKLPVSITASLFILMFTLDYLGYGWRFLVQTLVALVGWVLLLRFVLVAPFLTWFNKGPLDYAGYAENGAFWLWITLASVAIIILLFLFTGLILRLLFKRHAPPAVDEVPVEPPVLTPAAELPAPPPGNQQAPV